MTRATIFALCCAVLFASGCFDAPKPACAFLCESGTQACPDGYTCAADGWCKRNDVDELFVCDDTVLPTFDAAVDASDMPDATPVDAASIDAPTPDAGLALGSSCTTGSECNSGFCADDVCCESPCGNDCDVCSAAAGSSADGQCEAAPTTVECRAAAGECDVAENCDGSTTTCPSDGFETSGTQCTDTDTTDCDDAQCDGSGACVQTGGVELATYQCRPAAGECDIAENCDGSTGGACPADVFEAVDTPCGDPTDTECTNPDTCDSSGTCLPNHAAEESSCSDLGGGEDTCCTGMCIMGPSGPGTCS